MVPGTRSEGLPGDPGDALGNAARQRGQHVEVVAEELHEDATILDPAFRLSSRTVSLVPKDAAPHLSDLPQAPFCHPLLRLAEHGSVTELEPDLQERQRLAFGFEQPVTLVQRQSEGLLAENRQPAVQRGSGDLAVALRRGRHNDAVQVGALEQFAPVGQHGGVWAEPFCGRRAIGIRPRADRHQLHVVHQGQVRQVRAPRPLPQPEQPQSAMLVHGVLTPIPVRRRCPSGRRRQSGGVRPATRQAPQRRARCRLGSRQRRRTSASSSSSRS